MSIQTQEDEVMNRFEDEFPEWGSLQEGTLIVSHNRIVGLLDEEESRVMDEEIRAYSYPADAVMVTVEHPEHDLLELYQNGEVAYLKMEHVEKMREIFNVDRFEYRLNTNTVTHPVICLAEGTSWDGVIAQYHPRSL